MAVRGGGKWDSVASQLVMVVMKASRHTDVAVLELQHRCLLTN